MLQLLGEKMGFYTDHKKVASLAEQQRLVTYIFKVYSWVKFELKEGEQFQEACGKKDDQVVIKSVQ